MSAPKREPRDASDAGYADEVRRKSERLKRARRQRSSAWHTLATVGTLGWMLALPLLGGALLGHLLSRVTGRPALALVMILIGLVIGAYTTWRYIRRAIGGAP